MGRNSHYSLESAWEEITKVKSKYNRDKLIAIYQKAAPFVQKYQDTDIKALSTPEFARDYLPILRLIVTQSAGKKFLLTYTANPYIGITKSISWMIWMPTRVGSRAAMTILNSYIEELEQQANGGTIHHASSQADSGVNNENVDDENVDDENVDDKNVDNGAILVSTSSSIPDLVPVPPEPILLVPTCPENEESGLALTTNNDSALTSGVGCDPNDEWSASDGEIDEIMAACIEKSKIAEDTPTQPLLNSTLPAATPQTSGPEQVGPPERSSGPRRLTKGSRRKSFRDSGINLASVGAWEENSRKDKPSTVAEECIAPEDETPPEIINLTDMEISRFENGDDDVFEGDSSDSFIEIPDLE